MVTWTPWSVGGNRCLEGSRLSLHVRQSPLDMVRRGSCNAAALEVLTPLTGEPEVLHAWITELGRVSGVHSPAGHIQATSDDAR